MADLLFQRSGDQLLVKLSEYSATVSLAELAPTATTWQEIYHDAPAYGRKLFDAIFPAEQMRALLASLPIDERLLLVTEDPLIASIPWEYLRDLDGKLLAARFTFVRGLPEGKRQDGFTLNETLEIVAVPVSPVDEERVLNVEGEWRNLIAAVTKTTPLQALTLKRVRPPTRDQLEQSQNRKGTSLLHFMGHGASRSGKAFLVFEDARAQKRLVDAPDFVASLGKRVFLVVLNSCLSAVVAPTEFGNIARSLVERGVPYALGMQCILPDDAAVVLSEKLYGFLLQGYSVEEALMRTRRAIEDPGKLAHPDWLAGIPVLYTSLRRPAPPFELVEGKPAIQPDPERLQHTCDLTALPQAQHFLGRSQEMSEALGVLLAPGAKGFVLLHGLGGIGKTSLARALAERVSWYYDDRVLALSFETFARLDQNQQRVIDETFADRFYNRLARFYGLDLSDPQYQSTIEQQQAILQQRVHQRSLLVLDNIETLFDAQGQTHAGARNLAAFIHRLREGNGVVVLTSRQLPPADWGACQSLLLSGLSEAAGADLFATLLPPDRRLLALEEARKALSHRVQGHPLSIRLLAARFADHSAADLETFLHHIETELETAEQATPTSLEDPERQRTLYACLDYSIKRLTPEQANTLRAASLFQAPFLPEFVTQILANEQALLHQQTLLRLSLLEVSAQSHTFPEGELVLLELHPMVRWYIEQHLPQLEAAWREQYGAMYASLLAQAYEDYDKDGHLRYLVRLSLPDSEAALGYLQPNKRSTLAYHLTKPYERLGQNRRALALYEQALEISQQLGEVRSIAVTQYAMANLLSQQGKPQEALTLFEQSLHTYQELGDVRSVAVTQANFCQLLLQQGETQRALVMVWDAYTSLQQHTYVRDSQQMQQLLLAIKWERLGAAPFDATWEQVIHDSQPDWLREAPPHRPVQNNQHHLTQRELEVIVANTIMVMTTMPKRRDKWHETIAARFRQAQGSSQEQDAAFFAAVLALLGGQQPSLPEDHRYADAWTTILAGIVAGGPQPNRAGVAAEVMQAINAFLNADDWEATQAVVEAQQALLFQAEVEGVFEQNMAQARAAGKDRWASQLEQHLELLRACKTTTIAQAFEQFLQEQRVELPFDPDLLGRSVTALLGSPQEKLAHAQYVMEQASQTTDEQLKALLQTIQLALVGGDLSQLGRDLQDIYRQTWNAIAATVEAGGDDPENFA